ncbi:MAG TPA: LacI family transcriptional regulator [Petrimonas sp.]|uniref:LacI family DNA-binding transcriptional regulator n=1 Tax=Petrimonas sp. TaxID=2023866 RepID=UPI0017758962|nr:LacI family transcriptional regulator [Petrimonas sp.]
MKKSKVTIYDIARELKVAPSTISRAISNSDLISDDVKEKVRAKAIEMGYNSRKFRVNKEGTIAIVVPEINNFFYNRILSSIQQKIDNKYLVSIFCSFNSVKTEKAIVSKLDPAQVCCLVITQSMDAKDSSHIANAEKKGIHVIMLNRVDYDYECPKFVIDNYMDSYLLTNHLVGSNYRRIAFAAKHFDCPIYKERIQAYKDVLAANNIPFNQNYIIYSELTNEDINEVVMRFLNLRPRPDAFILPGFTAALQAISIMKVYNISIPNEMAIVSFDEDPECKYSSPAITGIERPLVEIGNKIGELIFSICSNKSYDKNLINVFKSNLVIRGSSLRLDYK